MFEASSSIQYVLSSVSTPFNRRKTHHFCVNSYKSNNGQMDTLCGNMSMDVTPCVYLSVYL